MTAQSGSVVFDSLELFLLQLRHRLFDSLFAAFLLGQLLRQMDHRVLLRLLRIELLALAEDLIDPLIDLLDLLGALLGRATVADPGIGSKLAAIDEQSIARDHVQLDAQPRTVLEHLPEGLEIVPPELRDRLIVRLEPPGDPEERQIVVQRPFELARAANPVGVAIDQDLEHRLGVIRRTACLVLIGHDPQGLPIQVIHEQIVRSNRIVLGDILLDTRGQKHLLGTLRLPKSHRRTPFQNPAAHHKSLRQKGKTLPIRIVTQPPWLAAATRLVVPVRRSAGCCGRYLQTRVVAQQSMSWYKGSWAGRQPVGGSAHRFAMTGITGLIFGWLVLPLCCAAGADPLRGLQLTDVFVSGADGYHTYRIPALLVTPGGDLLAFCEGRKNSRGDTDDIDLLLKRQPMAARPGVRRRSSGTTGRTPAATRALSWIGDRRDLPADDAQPRRGHRGEILDSKGKGTGGGASRTAPTTAGPGPSRGRSRPT